RGRAYAGRNRTRAARAVAEAAQRSHRTRVLGGRSPHVDRAGARGIDMNMSLDDLASSEAFGGGKGRREQITWLPEPEPRERAYTVISVDDHVVEPPDAFTGRFPKRFKGEEPRIVPTDDGGEAWSWRGEILPNVGFNAVV